MNTRIVAHTFLLVLLISGCGSTVTPDIMPRLDPSPTPSGSTLPLTCQVTDLNVYINEMDGYCFAYPTGFTLGDQPTDKPDVRGPAIGSSAEPVYATFGVDVTPDVGDKPLRQEAEDFLRDFSVMDPATFTWSELQVGGQPALMVEPVVVQLAWRLVFVEHGGRLFRLSYWPVDVPEAKADLDDLAQTTLGSFAFTK